MRDLLGLNYRNVAGLAVVGTVLGVAYLVVSHPMVRYAAWLVVFAIWMAWFVAVAREWISRADF